MVAPPGGRAFKEVKAGITMGTAPMEIPAATSLNGGRVAILKMHIPYAHFCMGIRTIAAARAPTTAAPVDDGGARRRMSAAWTREQLPLGPSPRSSRDDGAPASF